MSQPAPDWRWPSPDVMLAVHEEQLVEHGGGTGVRDANLLASAMARPQQLANYAQPDAADLAASYGVGIARNHPFVDGNRRTAFVAVELFLALNGYAMMATDADCVFTMLDVAMGKLEEAAFAAWIRQHQQAL